MNDEDPSRPRRQLLKRGGAITLAAIAAGAGAAAPARAESTISASAEGKCGTCRFWGGMRRISEDRRSVSADGKGWCNNSASPAYGRQTKPTQGAPVWQRWSALES